MIDINKALKAFDEYVKGYNPNDEQVKLKIEHIKRVAEISKNMAIKLNLSEEDIKLAQLIGLLHDIGRFEQIRIYHTFKDKDSINHGELGVKILFEQGLIRKFIEDDKFDKIIKISILNHNRARIEDGLTTRELLHAKIIRDSDKTDIFNVLIIEPVSACYETLDMTKEVATPEIYKEFIENKTINYKNMRTAADSVVAHYAYVFDYNYNFGLEIIKENKYLEKIHNMFSFDNVETQKMINDVYEISRKYIDDRLIQEN